MLLNNIIQFSFAIKISNQDVFEVSWYKISGSELMRNVNLVVNNLNVYIKVGFSKIFSK